MADLDHPPVSSDTPTPPQSPPQQPSSPAAIWAARMAKELPQLQAQAKASDVRLEEGVCRLELELQGLTVEVELGRTTNYPFQQPVLRVLSGAELLPRSNVSPEGRVVLPALGEAWTPSTCVADLLSALEDALARGPDDNGGEQAAADAYAPGAFEPGQAFNTVGFKGLVLPCSVRHQGGAVQHRYLGVSDEWVLQLEADRTRIDWVVVVRAQPMLTVAKLKYRRGESLTVIFKDNSKWDLQMAASVDCVQAIQAAMTKQGIRGRRTSESALSQIERARRLIQEARRRERETGGAAAEEEDGGQQEQERPVLALEEVQGVVDLYREAIECLSSVHDENEKKQTQEVVALLHAFLLRPDVQTALEQAPPPPPPTPPAPTRSISGSAGGMGAFMSRAAAAAQRVVRKGEVLPRSEAEMQSQEDDGLAREERNLLKHGLQSLKKMLELGPGAGVAEGEAGGRQRTASGASTAGGGLDLSVSDGSAASLSASEEGGGGGGGGAGADDSVDATLQDLEGLLAQATSEFEKITSPEKPPVVADEGEGDGGGDEGAAATEAAAPPQSQAEKEADEEEEVVI